MDHEFSADEWNALAPASRAQRCRLLSLETHPLAQKAPPELRPPMGRLAAAVVASYICCLQLNERR